MSLALSPLLDDAWTAYCARKPKRAPYDLAAWMKAARAAADHAIEDHYHEWAESMVEFLSTGYPRLDGDLPDLRLVHSRPFRPAVYDLDGYPPTDCTDFPLTIYGPTFARRLRQLLAAAGCYKDSHEAYIYMTLADRYCRRGEWVVWALTELIYHPPTLPADFDAHCQAYFATASLRPAPRPSDTSSTSAQLTIF